MRTVLGLLVRSALGPIQYLKIVLQRNSGNKTTLKWHAAAPNCQPRSRRGYIESLGSDQYGKPLTEDGPFLTSAQSLIFLESARVKIFWGGWASSSSLLSRTTSLVF